MPIARINVQMSSCVVFERGVQEIPILMGSFRPLSTSLSGNASFWYNSSSMK